MKSTSQPADISFGSITLLFRTNPQKIILECVQIFSYKYDDYGNWIEKVEFAVEKGEVYPVLIIDRIYEYYK